MFWSHSWCNTYLPNASSESGGPICLFRRFRHLVMSLKLRPHHASSTHNNSHRPNFVSGFDVCDERHCYRGQCRHVKTRVYLCFGGSREPGQPLPPPNVRRNLLFCKEKLILEQIGQLPRLCKCKKAFSFSP